MLKYRKGECVGDRERSNIMGRKKSFECDCPVCGAFFDVKLSPLEDISTSCPQCGTDLSIVLDGIPGSEPEVELEDDNYISEEDAWADPVNNMPQCCVACGGPFPQCTTSCKIFDH